MCRNALLLVAVLIFAPKLEIADSFSLPPTLRPPVSLSGPYVRSSSLLLKQKEKGKPVTQLETMSIEVSDQDKPQSVGAATFSLTKSMVGSGVLALPAGLAVVSDAPRAVVPACLFILFLGALSAYSFYMVGKMCHENGSKSLGELWDKAVGKSTSWVVTLSIFVFTLGAGLTYSIVLGDAFSSLAETIGLQGWLSSRHASILTVTGMALWPLCNLKSLAALAPVSVVGVIATIVTCVFMGFRCLGSPYALPDGFFLPTLAPGLRPSFGQRYNLWSPSSFILASMTATSYMAHYLAPDFYHVLAGDGDKNDDSSDNDKNNNALGKFRWLVGLGFTGVILINNVMLAFGYLTFGGNCSGLILNNYSTHDVGATICRLLMAICVIGGFPFLVNASRDAFFQLSNTAADKENNREPSTQSKKTVTRAIVSMLTGLALVFHDAGMVLSFNGAVMGSAIIYMFPAIIYLKSTKTRLSEGTLQLTQKLRLERFMSRFLLGFGAVSAVVGGAVTIVKTFFPRLLVY